MSRRRDLLLSEEPAPAPVSGEPVPPPAAQPVPKASKSLWFVVPAKGRYDVTRVCLRQLARTCAQLADMGLRASAVVVADDRNLATAEELGFGTVERGNEPLGRKWNDGYELAGKAGVDYVIPIGTDDWITAEFVAAKLPAENEIRCARLSSVVSEDGKKLARLNIPYDGGDGVRVFDTRLLKPLGYRPIEEDRPRAIDTSMLQRISQACAVKLVYFDVSPFQIVDWKSRDGQLNSYQGCLTYKAGGEINPWRALKPHYPAAALNEMRDLYPEVK
jgi:hypothetical protein